MTIHLFEFMDHEWTPRPIRQSLLETLEACNSIFRPYYQNTAAHIIESAATHDISQIVELGAGSAPLTRHLLQVEHHSLKLTPCDLYPDVEAYSQLQAAFPDRVTPVIEPVDLREPKTWPKGTALLLCATLHHIREEERADVLRNLLGGSDLVLIYEPLRKTPLSIFLVLFACIPALLTPFVTLNRPGLIRRILFAWILPIVPLMFVWDAVVSCLRQWSIWQWNDFLESITEQRPVTTLKATPHSLTAKLAHSQQSPRRP